MKHFFEVIGTGRITEVFSALLLAIATGYITRHYGKKETQAKLQKDNEEAAKTRAEKDIIMSNHLLSQRDVLLEDYKKLEAEKEKVEKEKEELILENKKLKITNEQQAARITYLTAHQSKY